MNHRYRKTIIAGNWKMNKTPAEARALIKQLGNAAAKAKWCEVVCCVPYVDIAPAVKSAKGSRIAIGAQNVHQAANGAYTGEVSAGMLAASGVKYVIVGHSERRQYFGETNELVNKKVRAVLDAGLKCILCVGETLAERELGITSDIVAAQLKAGLSGVSAAEIKKVVVAYEPVWAIGTGRTATAELAGEVCEFIRATVRKSYGARLARAVTVQYGGSMNEKNAAELLALPDVDGGLIGGASLVAESFAAIIEAANQSSSA